MHVRLITYEPGQVPTSRYNVCTRADHGVTYVTLPEPPRSKSNITSTRFNVGGYASNTVTALRDCSSSANTTLERYEDAVLGPIT